MPRADLEPRFPPDRPPIRGVILDLDGVLVDSLEVTRAAFVTAYAEVVGDGPAPVEEFCRYPGHYLPEVLRMMGLPAEVAQPYVRETYRLGRQVPLVAGVAELLDTLRRRGVRLAVATGRSGPRARSQLDQLGVLSIFDEVVGADEVPRPKPAPDIVLRVLSRWRLAAREVVMVGDSVSDLRSAQQAGVGALAALWGETEPEILLAAGPDAVLHRPADLLAFCPAPASG